MEVFYQIVFFILALLVLGGALFALFSRKTMYSIIGAVVSFWGISGLYFLLGLHFLAAAQILIYGVAVAILFSFCVMFVDLKEEGKVSFGIDFKSVVTLMLLTVLGFTMLPFVNTALSNYNSYFKFALKHFAQEFYISAFLPFELVSILLLVGLVGIVAIVYRRRK